MLVFNRTELFILEALGEHQAVGIFALAFGLSLQLTAPADALLLPMLPAVAGIVSEWPERAREAFGRSTRVSAVVCGAILATVTPLLVSLIPVIYGRAFEAAAWMVVPLAMMALLRSVTNPVTAFTLARQKAGVRLRANVAALVVDLLLAVALIPLLGVWGAVIAAVGAQAVAVIWLAANEPFVVAARPNGLWSLYGAFVVGAGAAGTALILGRAMEPAGVAAAATAAALWGGLFFFVAIRLTGSGMSQRDLEAFLPALPTPARRAFAALLQPLTARD
jgi:O-antigen/teichoic acid export membrane protein